MRQHYDTIVASIRRRSREEWQREAREWLASARAWTQENGEWAAGLAFLTGIAIVLEFQLFLALLLIAAFVGFAIWQIALPEAEIKKASTATEQDLKLRNGGPSNHVE
jgi:hypothetical protein